LPKDKPSRNLTFALHLSDGADSAGRSDLKNFALNYVVIGAAWLLVGMLLGIVMGAKEDFQFAPVHAHINLIGFACHSIFGMAYKQWPMLNSSRLAPYQFWIFVIATPITLLGLVFTLTGGPALPTILGSIGVFVGAALFFVMVSRLRLAAE
jgi:hypothetical protein